jgi:hypothetical protein
MKRFHFAATALALVWILAAPLYAARHSDGPLTPIRNTTTRGAYTIDTVGDTLHQAPPQNTRLIIRVAGADKKMIKPDRIALIDKSGAAIEPVFREDRKVGHEENTGLPLSVGGYGDNAGYRGAGVGVNLNKLFGPHGDYAYSKVDWPKTVFTSDKKLQIVMPGGQAFVLPLTSLAQ